MSRQVRLCLGVGALLALVALAGLAALRAGTGTSPPAPSSDEATLARRVERLERELDAQRLAHERLAAELSVLRARIALAEVPTPERPSASPSPAATGRATTFDVEGLVETGMRRADAGELYDLWEKAALAKALVSARASEEGWAGTPRHRSALEALETNLRTSLGGEDYDRYLWASHVPNRLLVQEVSSDSPAEHAGLLPGDRLLRYDGERLFSAHQLEEATAAGSPEGTIRLEIERDGHVQDLRVPGGPLGLEVAARREPPRP